jgi:hypothetical protein
LAISRLDDAVGGDDQPAGEPAIANGAIVPLTTDPTANMSVFLGTGPGTHADLVLDVTGYFQ